MIDQLRTWLLELADHYESEQAYFEREGEEAEQWAEKAAAVREFVATELSDERCAATAEQLQSMLAMLP